MFAFLQKEISYFHKLTHVGKRLIISYILFEMAAPLFSVFINAYVWRETNSMHFIAVYNLALFVISPVAFYLNGLLLRWFKASSMYAVGCILLMLSTVGVVFLPQIDLFSIILYGALSGLANGMYWANLKLITQKATTKSDRVYFSALQSGSATFINVLIPFLIGYVIAFGDKNASYTVQMAYQFFAGGGFVIMIIAGLIMYKTNIVVTLSRHIHLSTVSPSWNKFRWLQVTDGFVSGANYFVPTLMVLFLVGQEDELGTIKSITALIAAGITYVVGRTVSQHGTLRLLAISLAIYLLGSVLYTWQFGFLGVIVYYIALTLFEPLQWTSLSPITHNLIDDEKLVQKHHEYQYIFDVEVFLNIGRALGVVLFLVILEYTSQELALRFAPLIFALLLQFQWVLAYAIMRR
jgi:YQGE family putative transporter